MIQKVLNCVASLSFLAAVLLHIFFVYKTSVNHIDISFIVTSKSIYAYFVIYTINVVILYAIISLVKIFIGFGRGGLINRAFLCIDISSFIFGLIVILLICAARGVQVY